MAQLEAVYLANVILHIDTTETVIKLIQINRKCKEATKIIRYYNTRRLYENDENNTLNYVVVKNLFDLFPNVETVNCKENDVRNNMELFYALNQIELTISNSFDRIKLPQEITNKIIQLNIVCDSLQTIQLTQFPNVRKVKVRYEDGNLKGFLGDNQIRLSQLIVETKDNEELDCLEEYNNIESKIIKIVDGTMKERYLQLKEFATVYAIYPIEGIDIKETLGPFDNIYLSNDYDINKMYDLTLFTRCQIASDCDLRHCEMLEEITTSFFAMNEPIIQIEGLQQLKRIEYAQGMSFIPSSLTKLAFNPNFNYDELLKEDANCFNNIKEVNFGVDRRQFECTKLLLNFRNCTKITFHNYLDNQQPFKFPLDVRELIINNYVDECQINEITELKKLKILKIDFDPTSSKKKIQGMFNCLEELECLKTNCIEGITLPSSLNRLELYGNDDIDLSQHSNLKDITLDFDIAIDKQVKLPTKLTKLYVCGNAIITNSNEIEVDRVILDYSKSQLCEWKSRNVFITNFYEDLADYFM